ncbi:hypothetical protein [Modestobacter sp. SYSU DS0290]
MSQYPSTPYVLAGEKVEFPDLAAGTAIKNSAKRFTSDWGLPPEAAFALSAAMVDPAADRLTIDPKNPTEHLRPIQTPAGKFLLTHHTRLWTPLVSGDGGNGRSRYAIQTANGNGARPRPWPIGRHHKPAIIDYHPASLEAMTDAVKLSANEIRSQDLITQIARNPRGVWNPPVVVLARAFFTLPNGEVKERWFLHTIEGSTRVEGCHELSDIDPAAPLQRSDEPLVHLRDAHAQFVERFTTTPSSQRALATARAATMPALVVVAVTEEDGLTPISDGFPVVVNDYVESVHVQPRQFSDVAASNVIGERFLMTLTQKGKLTNPEAEALLGRDPHVAGKPSVRAAQLVHAVCAPGNDEIVRNFAITDNGKNLTKVKRARLVGPLVVRQFNESAPSAERALMYAFTPDLLINQTWSITGVGSETLRKRCAKDVAEGKFETPSIAELMARGGPALCASGLLLSNQASTVEGINILRGAVDKVVESLSKTLGGVNVLADAIAWADGERKDRPRQFDVEGKPRTDKHGDQLHYAAAWQSGNMGVRALAFNKGVIPKDKAKTKESNELPPPSPEEQYQTKEKNLLELVIRTRTTLWDLYAMEDEKKRRLIRLLGLTKAEAYAKLPGELTQLYAKFGKDDDPFGAFGEDDLPDGEPDASWVDSEEANSDDDLGEDEVDLEDDDVEDDE